MAKISNSSLELFIDEEDEDAIFTEEGVESIDRKVDWSELYHAQLNWELWVVRTHISDFTPENILKIKWFCPEEVADYYKCCAGKTPV